MQPQRDQLGLGARGTDPARHGAGQVGRQALRRLNAPVPAARPWAQGAELFLLSLVEARKGLVVD